MARTPEGRVKDACVALLKRYNAYYFYPMTGGFGRSGVPDIVVCYRGLFLGVECKAGYNKTTPLQDREIAAIHKAGGSAMVVREDTVELLEHWLKERANE